MLENLINTLKHNRIRFDTNASLAKKSYFKTGGEVKLFIYPENIESIKITISTLKEQRIDYQVVGAMSNILFADGYSPDCIVCLRKFSDLTYHDSEEAVTVSAGYMLPKFVRDVVKMGFCGIEGLEGIPGTLGGAIYMNAGAYGFSISDHLLYVDVITKSGEFVRYAKEELDFSFRHSRFKLSVGDIIVSAAFHLTKGDVEESQKKVKQFSMHRKMILEYDYPNLGSTFATTDIYSELARFDRKYKLILLFMRTFVHRLLRVKNNRILNKITFRYYNISIPCHFVSDKTMNTIINIGCSTKYIIEYIERIRLITNKTLPLEIEIYKGNK